MEIGRLTFKSVIRVPNSQEGLVWSASVCSHAKRKSEKNLFAIYSTYYADKKSYQRNKDADHIIEEVLNSLNGQVKT
jgi:hypothetical protein